MNPDLAELFDGLPAADRMMVGLSDYREGRRSIPACLVRMARPRLSRVGAMPETSPSDDGAELELYQLLSASEGAASFSRYNALIRELISFEHALDHRMSDLRPSSRQSPEATPDPTLVPAKPQSGAGSDL